MYLLINNFPFVHILNYVDTGALPYIIIIMIYQL